jgi:hypothetical protein
VYCAVLGPRLCGKTELLRYVEQVLVQDLNWVCVTIDLAEMCSSNLQGFFAEMTHLASEGFSRLTGAWLPEPEASQASSAVFRAFLLDSALALKQDTVLIIEHLEALPTDLVQALLTSLRAAYMDQQTQEQRVTVVVSGALSLASLTVGESSPFRGIARRVFLKDLSEVDSLSLIGAVLEEQGVALTNMAQKRLLQSVSGDPFLIRHLTRRSADLARNGRQPRLHAASVQRITREFLRDEVYQYAPLIEALHLIEEDPDLLHCILMLLERELVPKTELPLPLSPDLDPLYLTGVVDLVGGNAYRLQNRIYHEFLQHQFAPRRVGHALAMTGRWDQAIDQLALAARQGDRQSSTELVPAIINSIYAAQDLRQAAHFLTRGLSAAFGINDSRIWYAPPQEDRLRLVGQVNPGGDEVAWEEPEIFLSADRLEARAYRFGQVMRGPEREGVIQRAIPLLIPGRPPIGVVTLVDQPSDLRFIEQRERELHLLGFLRQAARAFQSVGMHRQELVLAGRLQASLLPETPPQFAGWQFDATWRPARETAGDFYDFITLPGGRIGFLVADVVDKGMGAALFMALSRTLIRTFAAEHPGQPGRVLQAVNQRMLIDADIGHFVTVFYAALDPLSGRLVYCNAGHNPPFLYNSLHRSATRELAKTGPALGVMTEGDWQTQEIQLVPGDVMLLYTDGVVDALNHHHQSFGEARMLETVQELVNPSAPDIVDALVSAVRAFIGNAQQYDDITILAVLRMMVSRKAEIEAPRRALIKYRPVV